MTASDNVNLDEATVIRDKILSKMAENSADTRTFTNKDKAATMAFKKAISCGKGSFYMEHDYIQEIFRSYVSYVTQHYDKAIILFDGYTAGPRIKDCTHMRRTKGMSSPEVHFTHEMKLTIKKEIFTRNNENKERFIQILGPELASAGYKIL
ncbi:hypothetical protein PR048_024056 [Dryococelus australis]|uniref:Uncharacterized protein n=1 Tax=Dryococelus australis TaxID=614101 RepID=A0ABQ9GVU0_9NEOP|nr:hypothetical protein PR048_024056 [Dryococelus australis]